MSIKRARKPGICSVSDVKLSNGVYLIILLHDEEIVQSLVDRFVVVVLYGSQIRFHQRQLLHLNDSFAREKAKKEALLFCTEETERGEGVVGAEEEAWTDLAEEVDGASVVESGRKYDQQVVQ